MKKLLLLAGLACSLLFGAAPASANDDLMKRMDDPNQWAIQTGDYANTRYSKLDQINASNVNNLQVSWTFSTGVLRGHEGAPLVVGDMMYVHTPFPNTVYALDLNEDGKIVWKYEPKQDPNVIPGDVLRHGQSRPRLRRRQDLPAPGRHHPRRARRQDRQGRLVGRQRRSEEGRDQHRHRPAGQGQGHRRHFGRRVRRAVPRHRLRHQDRQAGLARLLGRARTISSWSTRRRPPSSASRSARIPSLKTWQGDQWKTGGGCTWGWYSYDPKLDLFYYGSGNPSTWNPKQRPGDNKWSMTIFARNPDTGMAKWVYQMTPHDEWDYDGVNEMILADQKVDGKERKLLVPLRPQRLRLHARPRDRRAPRRREVRPGRELGHQGRHGQVAPRPTAGRSSCRKYSTEQNGEDTNSKGICPAALGTKDQQPSAFSPKTGLFYVPTNHVCMDYEPFKVSYTPGQPYVGATLSMYPAPNSHGGMGNFIAWDATKGKIDWSIPEQFSVWSGALATAGDVVFYGTLEGYLKAVDAKTGKELYKFKTPSGIIGNVMTYTHKGKQYVAVLSGVGGWAGIGLAAGLTDPNAGLGAVGGYAALNSYTALGGQLTVFAIPN